MLFKTFFFIFSLVILWSKGIASPQEESNVQTDEGNAEIVEEEENNYDTDSKLKDEEANVESPEQYDYAVDPADYGEPNSNDDKLSATDANNDNDFPNEKEQHLPILPYEDDLHNETEVDNNTGDKAQENSQIQDNPIIDSKEKSSNMQSENEIISDETHDFEDQSEPRIDDVDAIEDISGTDQDTNANNKNDTSTKDKEVPTEETNKGESISNSQPNNDSTSKLTDDGSTPNQEIAEISTQENTDESLPSLKCPKDWFLYEETNTCYLVTNSTQTWDASNILCTNLGGSLASFHSANETKFVQGLLTYDAWIGLNDKNDKGYRWSDGTKFDYKNWAEGEPSVGLYYTYPIIGLLFSKEDCVELKKSKNYKWNDEVCTRIKQAICARKPELVPRKQCPEKWDTGKTSNCYKMSAIKLEYNAAVEFCSLLAVGSALATPSDKDQNNFVAEYIKQKNISSIWIGVNDIVEEETFVSANGFSQKFFNWDRGQPSESFFYNEDCVQFFDTGKWNDESCNYKFNFVCTLKLD